MTIIILLAAQDKTERKCYGRNKALSFDIKVQHNIFNLVHSDQCVQFTY